MPEVIETLDAIVDERSLLKHPVYQAGTAGTLPVEALREYADDWNARLLHAPNHREHWPVIERSSSSLATSSSAGGCS